MGTSITLEDVVSQYAIEHANFLSANYLTQLRNSVSVYEKYLGHQATIEDFETKTLNAFLVELKSRNLAPKTIKHRRNSLMTLWRWCYEELLTDKPPRAKRVVLRPSVPKSWTAKQLCDLICAMMEDDQKRMSNGIVQGLYFGSLTLALYSSGLRLADVLKARRKDVGTDGSYQLIANKTGRLIVRTLDPRAVGLALNGETTSGIDLGASPTTEAGSLRGSRSTPGR